MRNFRNRIAEKYLKINTKNNIQKRKTTSFRQIKTIGIVYDATFEETVKEVKSAIKKLKALGKDVYSLGFVNTKVLPANRSPHTRDDFFCKQDLHWYQLPKKDRIGRFSNETFDYLLNVYTDDQLPLIGVSALSKAHCRLGSFHRKYTGSFDVMLKEKGNKTTSELLDAYILFLYKLKHE